MSFKLTDKGEDAAINPASQQGLDLKVVGFMYLMKSPVEIEEIMDETNMGDEAAVNVMKRLIKQGYVEEL